MMKTVRIKYCQPCGYMPRAFEMAKSILDAHGMAYNKKLSVSLEPGDHGIFEVVIDDKVAFSKENEGRFPENVEIVEMLKQKPVQH